MAHTLKGCSRHHGLEKTKIYFVSALNNDLCTQCTTVQHFKSDKSNPQHQNNPTAVQYTMMSTSEEIASGSNSLLQTLVGGTPPNIHRVQSLINLMGDLPRANPAWKTD